MQRCIQDKTDVPDDERLHELLVDITEACQIARRAPSKGCVYVMAVPNIEAVRIGRTVDLPQRLRWFEYKNFPVEVILLGKGNAFDPEAKKAEAAVFHLLDDIHLRERNPQLYVDLVRLRSPERLGPGYDWYLPDRRRILEAFWKLCRGSTPRFVGVQKQPAFERFTKLYPAYATPDQIF